jgi:hypothetical protein
LVAQEEALIASGTEGPPALAAYSDLRSRCDAYRQVSGGPVSLVEPVPGGTLSRQDFKAALRDLMTELRVPWGALCHGVGHSV